MVVSPIEAYIRQAAGLRGIDPDIAVKVAKSEGGLKEGALQSYAKKNGIREPSYGPFQLLVGGAGTGFPTGLGNRFIEQTGLDPSDPANVQAAIDFALDHAKGNGWGAWYGAKNSGIGKWAGIGGGKVDDGALTAFAPSTAETPAESAVNAMAAGRLNNVPANPVQTVNYVPPPGSNATPQFTPLVAIPHLQPQETKEEQNAPPAPPVAQPAPSPLAGGDLMRAWGLSEENTPVEGGPAPVAAQPSPQDALIKAWGLDQNEEAPAAGLAGVKREPQTPQEPSTIGDVAASGASGLVRGSVELAGLPVTLGRMTDEMQGGASNYLVDKIDSLVRSVKGEPQHTAEERQAFLHPTSTEQGPLAKAQDAVRGFMDQNLYAPKTTAGEYAKTVGEFVPAAAAGGGNMLTNVVKYGVIPGVASEAAGQATEGTKFEPYARIGGALLAPLATEGLLRGAEGAGNKLLSMTPSGASAKNLTEALSASGTSADDVIAEMARNPRFNPMDVDPNLQQMGMNLANQGGAPRSILNTSVENRLAGAKGAVQDAYDSAIGSVPDVKVYLDNLKATTAANGKKAFDEALVGAKPVDISPVLESIDKTISPGINGVVTKASDIPMGPVEQALTRVRAKLANGNEMLTDADRLHQIQSQLRTEADTLAKSASGQDKLVAGALRDVRQKLITQIDDATGGKFRPAQKQYADDNAIQEAFDKGREVFKNGTGDAALENRPEYWQAWKKEASPAELDAAKVGARVAVDQMIRGVRNAAQKGASIADVELNTSRLSVLLGKQETIKLAQVLKDEQKIAQTNAKLFSGSQTAPRQAANKLTEVTQPSAKFSFGPGSVGAAGALYSLYNGAPLAAIGSLGATGLAYLGKYGAQRAMQARDIARNRLMAEALSGDVTRFRDAVAPAATANRLLAPIRRAQTPLLRSSGAVPLSVEAQSTNELLRPSR